MKYKVLQETYDVGTFEHEFKTFNEAVAFIASHPEDEHGRFTLVMRSTLEASLRTLSIKVTV